MSWLGGAGTALVIVAYLPQIVHLIREHCSAGISCTAFGMWGLGGVLLLSYAISLGDPVFTVLQTYQLGASSLICFFGYKYKDSLCDEHGGPVHQTS